MNWVKIGSASGWHQTGCKLSFAPTLTYCQTNKLRWNLKHKWWFKLADMSTTKCVSSFSGLIVLIIVRRTNFVEIWNTIGDLLAEMSTTKCVSSFSGLNVLIIVRRTNFVEIWNTNGDLLAEMSTTKCVSSFSGLNVLIIVRRTNFVEIWNTNGDLLAEMSTTKCVSSFSGLNGLIKIKIDHRWFRWEIGPKKATRRGPF